MQNEMQRIQALEQKVQAQVQQLQQQSISAVEKELPTALSSNKNLSLSYHFIESTVPSLYLFNIWIAKQNCGACYFPPTTIAYSPQLQVAV